MRIGWIILLPLILAAAAAAEDAENLPDPFLDGLFVGETYPEVEAALEENGWETSSEWYNLDIDPIYRVRGEKDNRTLVYEFNIYGQLYNLKYLEGWPTSTTRNDAFSIWFDWLNTLFGTQGMGSDGYPQWVSRGYVVRLYDRTFVDRDITQPTVMVNIYPESDYVFPTEDEVIIRPREE